MTSYRDRRLAGVHTDGSKAFLADRGLEPAPKEAKAQAAKSTSTSKRGPYDWLTARIEAKRQVGWDTQWDTRERDALALVLHTTEARRLLNAAFFKQETPA